MAGHHHSAAGEQRMRLRLISSPVVGEKNVGSESSSLAQQTSGRSGRFGVGALGFRDGADHVCPEFQKHEEATNIENLTVFSEVHEVTGASKLTSYIGYFCLLWLTWALVGMFDVRFVTDSIFERVARSCHLGVMIGFAVVAPNFNPDEQDPSTFRAMSIILMVSRLTLTTQYASVIWHVRKYRSTHLPLALMTGVNFIAAMIYLGLTFAFHDENSNVYIAWYVVAVCEMLINIGFSLRWEVLRFTDTHLINRMSLLTLIIIGEGIIVIANNVTVVVKNPDSWTPATIGVVTSAVGTIYMTYQIYFDWKRHMHLPPVRQLVWVFLHFPFHLALTLFVEGSSQFILWWKITEVMNNFYNTVLNAFNPIDNGNVNVTTSLVVSTINDTIQGVFNEGFSPKYSQTIIDINEGLDKLSTLPNSFWAEDPGPSEEWGTFNESVSELYAAVQNSLFAAFNIDAIGEAPLTGDGADFENDVAQEDTERFYLVFIYTFAAAGCVLILLNILFIVSKHGNDRWGFFNYVRVALNFVLGFGLALLPLMAINPDVAASYYETPWILPSLLLIFLFIVILNHLPHPPPLFFSGRKRSQGAEEEEGEAGGLPVTQQGANAAENGQTPGAVDPNQYREVVGGYQKNPSEYQNHFVVYEGVNQHSGEVSP